jgi:hypothetical protein
LKLARVLTRAFPRVCTRVWKQTRIARIIHLALAERRTSPGFTRVAWSRSFTPIILACKAGDSGGDPPSNRVKRRGTHAFEQLQGGIQPVRTGPGLPARSVGANRRIQNAGRNAPSAHKHLCLKRSACIAHRGHMQRKPDALAVPAHRSIAKRTPSELAESRWRPPQSQSLPRGFTRCPAALLPRRPRCCEPQERVRVLRRALQ